MAGRAFARGSLRASLALARSKTRLYHRTRFVANGGTYFELRFRTRKRNLSLSPFALGRRRFESFNSHAVGFEHMAEVCLSVSADVVTNFRYTIRF